MTPTKLVVLAAFVAGASAFVPAQPAFTRNIAVYQEQINDANKAAELGWSLGGESHTRDPAPVQSDDPRKVIPDAPTSFEEYMKSRNQ